MRDWCVIILTDAGLVRHYADWCGTGALFWSSGVDMNFACIMNDDETTKGLLEGTFNL